MKFKNPFKQRFKHWMSKRNPPTTERIQLFNRRLYILPTRFGVMYCFLLVVIFLAAINYQNSLSFALSFLLTAIGIISLWQTHRNILNLDVTLLKPLAVFNGEKIELMFKVNNPHHFEHYSIGVQYQQTEPTYFSLDAHQQLTVTLPLNSSKRGEYLLDGITFFTRFPTGLFHCWSWLRFSHTVTVYPKPINTTLTTYSNEQSDEGISNIKSLDGDDFAGLRDYKEGESLKHISWKALAQGKGKLTKTYQSHAQPSLWLDWDLIKANSIEEKLSKLTSLIIKAHALNQSFGLKLPHMTIDKSDGNSHKNKCLHALACYQQSKNEVYNAES